MTDIILQRVREVCGGLLAAVGALLFISCVPALRAQQPPAACRGDDGFAKQIAE